MKLLLVGAGGHASVVADVVRRTEHSLVAYIDPGERPAWLDDVPRFAETDAQALQRGDLTQLMDSFVMGIGGVTPDALAVRLKLFCRYAGKFTRTSPGLVHPRAFAANPSDIGPGAVVMPGAIVNANASVGRAVIVNSGAIVEHDAVVEEGAHVAPGAVVLGAAVVGACAMIGAGAVILPGARVMAGEFVRAQTRYG